MEVLMVTTTESLAGVKHHYMCVCVCVCLCGCVCVGVCSFAMGVCVF